MAGPILSSLSPLSIPKEQLWRKLVVSLCSSAPNMS
jgi:hypothetical protein